MEIDPHFSCFDIGRPVSGSISSAEVQKKGTASLSWPKGFGISDLLTGETKVKVDHENYPGVPAFFSNRDHPDDTILKGHFLVSSGVTKGGSSFPAQESTQKQTVEMEQKKLSSDPESYKERKIKCIESIAKNIGMIEHHEQNKIAKIISYIRKIRPEEESKLSELESIIQVLRAKATFKTDFSFKKNLLMSFLILEDDLPPDIKEIDAENNRLLSEHTDWIDFEAISPAEEEFKDPYLRGNKARYSQDFLFIENTLLERSVCVPVDGDFEGGVFLREKYQRKTECVILAWFEKIKLNGPFPSADQPLDKIFLETKDPELQGNQFYYTPLIQDIGRCDVALKEDETSTIISSAGMALSSKRDSLERFTAFIGQEELYLGIAIARMMNQTMYADVEEMRCLRDKSPSTWEQLGFGDHCHKGFLYFQYFPPLIKKEERNSYVLEKENKRRFKITANYSQNGFLSSEDGEEDMPVELNYHISYRISASSNYNSNRAMTLENLPCRVDCLGVVARYYITKVQTI
ncbi:MAG: hypothetical protein ACOYK6_06635 [Chthoniobacterales bacterium]